MQARALDVVCVVFITAVPLRIYIIFSLKGSYTGAPVTLVASYDDRETDLGDLDQLFELF
jgi:hypothetical protein